MEFWPENQGQSHLYSKFGTVPGRNCALNYHDRHQPTHYPLYYGEQQDQSRESSYWTIPGSRTAGALHEYTNWTDPDLVAPSSDHFPFFLGRNTQHHQDLGEYQLHEARDREWKAAHRAARDHERGLLREGWQRRWEPCSPVYYNREVSAKRSNSSYRELEAWAARYSHSLPRRRRIEAVLRGASQGLVESSRSETDPQVAALQHVQQTTNIREPGLWDRGGKQQTLTYYPSQAAVPHASHMLDTKESYQRRIFSQPPGYIAPPPYKSPLKSSPVVHSSDTNWEQDATKQTYWLQPTLRKQDMPVHLQDKRKGGKEITDPGESEICPRLEQLKDQRSEADALQTICPISVQQTHIQCNHMLSIPHPQVVQNSEIIKETSSKVIEGRKFSLSKKTGGMTIFCLVSRIADPTETPSLPLCTSKTNIQHTEMGEVSKPLEPTGEIDQMLADEVDFRAPTLTGQLNTCDMRILTSKERETPPCTEKEKLGDNVSNKAEENVVKKENTNDTDRQIGQLVEPVSVKYPLWREPSFTSRAETQCPSTFCLKGNSEDKESDDPANVNSPPTDTEVRRLDIKEDTEHSKGLLVIDTTCVVVKMEQIPSPMKEHVHYLGSTALPEDSPLHTQMTVSPDLKCQLNQDVATNQSTEAAPSQKNESPETNFDSMLLEKEEHKQESEISLPCMLSDVVSERETLEERAERILGIPLHDCIPEPKDVMSFTESSVEENEEGELSSTKTDIHDVIIQTPDDTAEDEQSQNPLEDLQTEDGMCLKDHDDPKDQVTCEDGGDFIGSQNQVLDEENNTDIQLEAENKTSTEFVKTEDPLLESAGEKGTSEHDQEHDQSDENSQYSQPPVLSNSLLLPADLPSLSNISDPNTEDPDLDLDLAGLNTANLTCHPESSSLSSLHQLPSFLFSQSSQSSSASTPHTDDTPSPPPPLDLIDQTAEAKSDTEDQDEEAEILHLMQNELGNEPLALGMSEELLPQQQYEGGQLDDTACVIDEQQAKEADEELTMLLEQNIVNILPQKLESVQTESVSCLKESRVSEKEQPEEGLPVQSSEINEENAGQTEAKLFQQQCDYDPEETAFCMKESYVIEDKLQTNPDEFPVGLWEQTMCKNNASDSQMQRDTEIIQDTEAQTDLPISSPLATDCGVSQLPLDELSFPQPPSPPPASSECEFSSLLDIELGGPLPPHPGTVAAAADIPEIVPPSLSPDCTHSSFSESPLVLPPSSIPLYQEESLNVSPDFFQSETDKEYPKSLWDAVNRIRKHTAPDSENEEEEVTEMWDPENLAKDLAFPDVAIDPTSEKTVFNEAEQQNISKELVEMEEIQQDHKKQSRHAEEDTLSCSSTSSHGSGDTVIVADENWAEEMVHDAETEHKTERESALFNTTEVQLCYSDEEKDEATAEESKEEEEEDTNESCLSLESPVEIMETDAI